MNPRRTQHRELAARADVFVFIVRHAAVVARVIVRHAADQEVAAAKQ